MKDKKNSTTIDNTNIERINIKIIKHNLSKNEKAITNSNKQSQGISGGSRQPISWKIRTKKHFKHAKYLRNLISIENQHFLHSIIRSYSKMTKKVVSSTLMFQWINHMTGIQYLNALKNTTKTGK